MIVAKGEGTEIIGVIALKEKGIDAHLKGKATEGTDQELLKKKRGLKISHRILEIDPKRRRLKMDDFDGTLHQRKKISKELYWLLPLRSEHKLVPLKRHKACYKILALYQWLRQLRSIGNYMLETFRWP